MANLPETEAVVNTQSQTFVDGVYQFELTDPVQGGEDGIDNRPIKTLTNRTLYLLKRLFEKAPINSPTFTGEPNTPSPASTDNSTRIPNTNWVRSLISAFAPIASPSFTGSPQTTSPAVGDNSARIPNTNWVRGLISDYATNASVNSVANSIPGSNHLLADTLKVNLGNNALAFNQVHNQALSFVAPKNGKVVVKAYIIASINQPGLGLENKLLINNVLQDINQVQGANICATEFICNQGGTYTMTQSIRNRDTNGAMNTVAAYLEYLFIAE